MKLGSMQPYFFPYLGYYSLIKTTDKFILFDTCKYIRHGWINRNRILKPGEGWQYIIVPLVKHKPNTKIKDIEIANNVNWRETIIRQLEHYKKKAPYYEETLDLVESLLYIETNSIIELNAKILTKTCKYLRIPLDLEIYSQMNLSIDEVKHSGEWALNISKSLNAEEYINPYGGAKIYKPEQFARENISFKFLSNNLSQYNQKRPSFEAGLSIIDVMMFNDVDMINYLINDFKFLTKNEILSIDSF